VKNWTGFFKKHFKKMLLLLLAIVIVVSYSLSRSSDRSLRAGGFPGEEQGTDGEFGEDFPGEGATSAAPVELLLDEQEGIGEKTPEETPAETGTDQEGFGQEAVKDDSEKEGSPEFQEGSSPEEASPAESAFGGEAFVPEESSGQEPASGEEAFVPEESSGQESVSGEEGLKPDEFQDGSSEEVSVSGEEEFKPDEFQDGSSEEESVSGEETSEFGEVRDGTAEEGGISGETEFVAGEEDDKAGNVSADEGHDSGAEEDSANTEEESGKTFFTTEDEDAEQDPGQESEEPAGEGLTSEEEAGRGRTLITMEVEEETSTGETGAAAEAGEESSAGETGAAAEAGEESSTGGTGATAEAAKEASTGASSTGVTGATAEAAKEASTGDTKEEARPRGVADTLVFKGPDYTVTASYGEDAGIPAGASLVVVEIKEDSKSYQAYCDQAQAAVAESQAGGSGSGQAGSPQAESPEAGAKAAAGTGGAGEAENAAGPGTDAGESGKDSGEDSGKKENDPSPTDQGGAETAGNTGSTSAAAENAGAAAPETDTNVTVSWVRLFDITIEVDGVAVEPQGPVAVQIDYGQAIEKAGNEEVNTVHFEGKEEKPVVLETQTEGAGETLEQVTFEAEGFSVFAVMGTTITKRILASDGVGYLITLTCGPEAAIPANAELEVREILPESEEYGKYLEKAKDAIRRENQASAKKNDAETDPETGEDGKEDTFGISFARFFDIRILAGGKTIEPAAPVQVKVTYADALEMEKEDTLCAVHFARKGTEVIQASPDEDQKVVTFMQDSFSVTGTVVTSSGTWPAAGAAYVMYLKSGNDYYAVAHDGNLHQVWLSGKSLIFPDDAEGFDIGRYEWTHEQHSYGWTNYYYLSYTDSRGVKQYLDPSASGGISSSAVSLSRDKNGRIYSGSSYIGAGSNTLAGRQSSSKGAAIQFATDFSLPRKVTIHFVDRDGNALSGVSYKGPEDYPVIQNDDGTFALPYQWGLGNSSFTLQLDRDFSKDGYTYASTHLAGTREGKQLTHEGLTMDAALVERGNALYYYADAGKSLAYGSLTERNLNDALEVPNENGTGMTGYSGTKVDKDIYVILDPVPTYTPAQTSEGLDIEDPEFSKTLEDNGDGTYTLSLNVTGRGINASTNPKANVIFVVDTSSSMDKSEGTGTGHSRLHDTKPALKTLAQDLLLSNSMAGKDPDTVELSMISFDGGVVDEIGWTTDYNAFKNKVDNGLTLHRGTDWEDALKRAYSLGLDKQAEEPDQKVFVVFFTDGEGSQYTSFHGQGTYHTTVNPNYNKWYSYFLCRESAKDEARAIVNAGMQFYAIYAFNEDKDKYKGEAGSDLLRNLVRHAYNSEELGNRNFFARASNTAELEAAFNSILLSVREFLGVSDVVLNDDITSLTSTGINLVSSAVGGFSYSRSGGRYGSGTAWEDAPQATHDDRDDDDAGSVTWDLGSMVLEEGVTYTVSFKVWPSQEAYDWLANLENGTRTWDDVVRAGLDAPNGSNPQIVKNEDSYSLLTNRPSLDSDGQIINNEITYKKTHSVTVTEADIPAGTRMGTPIEGTDEDGNPTTTTYTLDKGVYTRTVLTEKKTCFKNPDPMPLLPERMSVMKKWETAMNTSHPADELKFRVLVDGAYYQKDGTTKPGESGQANAEALSVSEANDWIDSINIAPGIVKFYDDDGNALPEALVLETGHSYSVEEFDLKEGGSDFLYYTSYEFHSQTVRPMIVDGTLQYLVLIDAHNPAPAGAKTYVIGDQTWYAADSGSGQGVLTGTNYRTAELDVTKIIKNSSGADLTEAGLDAETFTYRITLSIPDGTDPAGIVGYEYVPRTGSGSFTLFGYQEGETAFASDIERFSGKTFKAWNTLVYRKLVEWENVGGRIVSKTDADGNILWKVPVDEDGYHSITYDMTLNRKGVLRFTNLPTGTRYSIREIYANYYGADNAEDSAGHAPIDKACNLDAEGYEIAQVRTTGGTVSKTVMENDTVSGIIDRPNVRYYNQFTNDKTSVTTQISILKTNEDGSKPLPGAVFDLYDKDGYEAEPQKPLQKDLTSSGEAGKEGTIDLGRLRDGTYYLVETAAPDGYIALTEAVTITVDSGSVSYRMKDSNLDDSGHGISGDFQVGYQLKVINHGGYELPATGGPGTSLLLRLMTALGAVLVVLAAASLARE